MLVLISLIWGHCGVFLVWFQSVVEMELMAEQPQGPLSGTNMVGRGSGGEEPEGSLHWCLQVFRKCEPDIPKMENWAQNPQIFK